MTKQILQQLAIDTEVPSRLIQEAYEAECLLQNMPQYLKIDSIVSTTKCSRELAKKALQVVWDHVLVEV